MKIALACQSVLLEKSLEIFLKEYLTPFKQCDFVISDQEMEMEKPLFLISSEKSDLHVPFSKSALILKVEKFYDSLQTQNETTKRVERVDVSELEEKIIKLTDNFRDDLIKVIKEYL